MLSLCLFFFFFLLFSFLSSSLTQSFPCLTLVILSIVMISREPSASSVRPSDCLGLQCSSHLSKVSVAGGREKAFTRLTAALRFHEEPSWQQTRVFLGDIIVRESREKFCSFSLNIMISYGLSQHQIQLSICILPILSLTFQIIQQKTHGHHYFKMEQLIFLLFCNSGSLTLTSLSLLSYGYQCSLKTLISIYLRCFVSLSLCSCLVSFL